MATSKPSPPMKTRLESALALAALTGCLGAPHGPPIAKPSASWSPVIQLTTAPNPEPTREPSALTSRKDVSLVFQSAYLSELGLAYRTYGYDLALGKPSTLVQDPGPDFGHIEFIATLDGEGKPERYFLFERTILDRPIAVAFIPATDSATIAPTDGWMATRSMNRTYIGVSTGSVYLVRIQSPPASDSHYARILIKAAGPSNLGAHIVFDFDYQGATGSHSLE